MRARVLLLAAGLWLVAAPANAIIVHYVVPLDGAQEFPGPGDPDGSGVADLILDTDTNTVTWNISVADIAAVSAAHIHVGAAGVSGPVRIDFSGQLSGSVVDLDVTLVVADPTGWYVNVHTGDFPAGAVRGQIPEPTTALLLASGLALLARRRATG